MSLYQTSRTIIYCPGRLIQGRFIIQVKFSVIGPKLQKVKSFGPYQCSTLTVCHIHECEASPLRNGVVMYTPYQAQGDFHFFVKKKQDRNIDAPFWLYCMLYTKCRII